MNNNHNNKIFAYLYRFRFLTRNHIQSLLNHKTFNRIIIWLNNLTDEKYIKRDYNPKTVTIPAIYSLGVKGRKYIKENLDKPIFNNVKESLLDRVWRDRQLTPQFKNHCLFIADIYLSLIFLTQKTGTKLNFKTQTDLYGMRYLIFPHPDIFFSIEETNGKKKYFFLDIFDELPPRPELKKRIKQYFEYYANEYWQDHTKVVFPNIIFIAPEVRSKNYLQRKIQEKLEGESDLNFFLSTWIEIKAKGLTREALQKVEVKE